jgi:hypothetical protein
MKKLLILTAILGFFCSCETFEMFDKNDDHKKRCEVVDTENVPLIIKSSFQEKHPEIKVDTWFNKDGIGYVALTVNGNIKTLTQFDNEGNFVNEESENENEDENDFDDQNEDENEDDGCECETDDDE